MCVPSGYRSSTVNASVTHHRSSTPTMYVPQQMVDRSGEISLYLVEGRRVKVSPAALHDCYIYTHHCVNVCNTSTCPHMSTYIHVPTEKVDGFDGILVITEPAPPSKHITARTDLLPPSSAARSLKAAGRSISESSSLGSESTDSGLLFPKGSSARRGRQWARPEATTGRLPHPPLPVLGTALPTDPCRRMSALFEGDGFERVLDGLFGRGGSSRREGGAGGGGGLMGSLAGYGFGGLGGLIGVLRGLRVGGGIKEEEEEEDSDDDEEGEDGPGNAELPPPLLALLEYCEYVRECVSGTHEVCETMGPSVSLI